MSTNVVRSNPSKRLGQILLVEGNLVRSNLSWPPEAGVSRERVKCDDHMGALEAGSQGMSLETRVWDCIEPQPQLEAPHGHRPVPSSNRRE